MAYAFNPFTGTLDYYQDGKSVQFIPELTADPVSPPAQSAWILRSGAGGGIADGTPIGLLLALTYTSNSGSPFTYQFSYQTNEGTTIRSALT